MVVMKCKKNVLMAVHFSDQFYLPYKDLPTIFNFAKEIVEQGSCNFMGSLDIYSLFTDIPLEETIEICTNDLFKNNDVVPGLNKNEFKDLLSWATKKSYFNFNNILYKQIDGVVIGPPLGPSLANVFLAHQNWLDRRPLDYRPLHYRWYNDDIFVLFKSSGFFKTISKLFTFLSC